MPTFIDIGGVYINPSQIQYARLFEKDTKLILYFAGRTMPLTGPEKDAVLEIIMPELVHPSRRTTALLPPPAKVNQRWETVKRQARGQQ